MEAIPYAGLDRRLLLGQESIDWRGRRCVYPILIRECVFNGAREKFVA